MGAVVSIVGYRRALAGGAAPWRALDRATLTASACERLAAREAARELQARALYDTQAKPLREYGIDPAEVLGPRP